MATYIFDIDGTVVHYHTNIFFDGVVEYIRNLEKQGHDILFITARTTRDDNTEWSMKNTYTLLQKLDITYRILFGVEGPRVLVDDYTPTAVHVTRADFYTKMTSDVKAGTLPYI